jgi:cytochrome o ubiquinol oxidase operon protein cyoD
MQTDPHTKEPPHGAGIGSVRSYGLSFLLCALLTLAAYFAVTEKWFSPASLIALVGAFGVLQIIVQLFLFIHLNAETKPRWNTIVFLFMILIVAIVVIGSIWIMHHLNYNMMPHP